MKQRGDTIIEVILAVTVFSMVAVGGLALMNQGVAMAQRSLEIGMVRDQMDAQADALRYIYNTSVNQSATASTAAWSDITKLAAESAGDVNKIEPFNEITDGKSCRANRLSGNGVTDTDKAASPFAIDLTKVGDKTADPTVKFNAVGYMLPAVGNLPTNDGSTTSQTYAQVRYNGATPTLQGIWIQAKHVAYTSSTFGYYDFNIYACWFTPGQSVPVTLGTVVRLYDPQS